VTAPTDRAEVGLPVIVAADNMIDLGG